MTSGLIQSKRHSEARRTIVGLVRHTDNLLIIHYSCESFYDRPDGRTPRITSIAVHSPKNRQAYSFSIHKVAELKGVMPSCIDEKYDELEKLMLKEYFDFVHTRSGYKWVHWNMRNINYGFAAIEHRYKVLGGKPEIIEDSKKYDLSQLLTQAYGANYIGHPRLEKLIDKNDITKLNFLSGKQEAEAFENKEYYKLHQSTLRKVDVFANILFHFADKTLKTDARWHEIYGVSPSALAEAVKDHWLFILICILGSIASIIGIISLF